MKKIISFVIAAFTVSVCISAQEYKQNYYVKDSMIYSGIKLLKQTAWENCEKCIVVGKSGTVELYPNLISEYGFGNGQKYVSKVININGKSQTVFLEQLSGDRVNLYSYENEKGEIRYFVERGKNLEEFNENGVTGSYKSKLRDYLKDSCNNISEPIKIISFKKKQLATLFDYYNSCNKRPFSYTKYGITAGASFAQLDKTFVSDITYGNATYKNSTSFFIGGFVDYPLALNTMSLYTELTVNFDRFSLNRSDDIYAYSTNIKSSGLSLPVLFRYTLPQQTIRPFVNLGPVFNFNFLHDCKTTYVTTTSGYLSAGEKNENYLYPFLMTGYSVGAGAQLKVGYRNLVSVEFRYSVLYALIRSNSANDAFGNKNFKIILGYSL